MALAAARTTIRAAARLHLTQSAVSRALANAEAKLGVPLFVREARGLAPTEAGARIVAGAPAIFAQLAALEAAARTPTPRPPLELRVVCECYTAYRWLPSAMAELAAEASAAAAANAVAGATAAPIAPSSAAAAIADLRVAVAFDRTSEPVDALAAGEVDLALVTTSRVAPPLRDLPLFDDEIVFLVGRDHPLAARAALHPADLRAYPLITSTTTPVAERRWFAQAVFGRRTRAVGGKHPPLAFPLTEALVDAARANLGIAVLSEWIAQPYVAAEPTRLLVKRLARPLRRPWRIAFRPEHAEPARRLATILAALAPHLAR